MGFFSGLFGGSTKVTQTSGTKVDVKNNIAVENILDMGALAPIFEAMKATGESTAEFIKNLGNIQKADVLATLSRAQAEMQQTELIRKYGRWIIGLGGAVAFYYLVVKD